MQLSENNEINKVDINNKHKVEQPEDSSNDNYASADQNNQDQKDQKKGKRQNSVKLRRKRKLKRKYRKLSPETVQQIKMMKINHIRENHWDSRFILETIPQFKEKIKKKAKLQSLNREPLLISVAKKTSRPNNTVFPSLTATDKIGKTFQIRVHTKKPLRQSQSKTKQFNSEGVIEVKKAQNEQNISIKLKKQIEELQEEYKYQKCHHNVLIQLCKKSNEKKVRKYLQSQIKNIRLGKANVCVALKMIEEREKQISKLKQLCDNKIQSVPKQNIINYRLATLKSIEAIMKWREEIERIYYQQFQTHKKISFCFEGINYFEKIGEDLKFLQEQVFFKCKTKDPFLISVDKETDKGKILKLRACQLLLLEEKLTREKE